MKLQFSQNEKQLARRAGKVYVNLLKAMGVFLVLALIMTAVTAADADPSGSQFRLGSGESVSLGTFYADSGEKIQIAFGIEQMNDEGYAYPEYENNEVNYYDSFADQEWIINAIVYRSESLSFEMQEKVADVSGEGLVHEFAAEAGFYKVVVKNLSDDNVIVWAGYATANMGLVVGTVMFWAGFGITTGIFSALAHIGFWITVLYLVIKVIMTYQEQERQRMQAYYDQVMAQQQTTEQSL